MCNECPLRQTIESLNYEHKNTEDERMDGNYTFQYIYTQPSFPPQHSINVLCLNYFWYCCFSIYRP